jgi:hypothetical protein
MNEKFIPDIIGTRHSLQAETRKNEKSSVEYFGLSESGVELAKQRASEILESLIQSKEGSLIAFVGSSETDRTKSTIRAYGDEISRLIKDKEISDIEVMDDSSFDTQAGVTENIQTLAEKVNSQPDKKFFIACPLFIKEMRLQDRWQNQDQNWSSEYAKELFTHNNFDNQKILTEWLLNQGIMGNLQGPNPKKVAEEEVDGIKRINTFISRFIKDRPITVGFVGHSPNIVLTSSTIYTFVASAKKYPTPCSN